MSRMRTAGEKSARRRLGAWGEDQAATRLREAGYRIVARNWRCPLGEIDVIAWSPEAVLCFIEVRTSRSLRYGGAVASITPRKQKRLTALAHAYLAGAEPDTPIRMDVYALQRVGGQWHHEHIANAFAVEAA